MTFFRNFIAFFCLIIGVVNVVWAAQAKDSDISTKEKIGQMLMIGFKGTELHTNDPIVHAILDQQIGGVILFDYNFQTKSYQHNIQNPEQLRNLTQQLQSYAKMAA